ncbi:MAG: nucleotidyltransferase substrate binding protein [Deltaproteobacteria bacterium]|nr:nucleotidyltransferase substrate binding protein [Deltaproteobacteria bacterium]
MNANPEKLDLSSLEKAIRSLDDILKQPVNPYVRDGVIQRFEYTVELCWKFLQRQLKILGVAAGNPKDVFREAQKSRLIDDPAPWFEFLRYRNLASHAYNDDVAAEVHEAARTFPPFAKKVLASLKTRNG